MVNFKIILALGVIGILIFSGLGKQSLEQGRLLIDDLKKFTTKGDKI